MKKINQKRIGRIVIVTLTVVLLAGVFGCQKAPIQDGDVDQELTVADLEIKGTIKFTENTAGSSEADLLAPKAIVASFERTYPGTKVVFESADRSSFPARISSGDIGDVFWVDATDMHKPQRPHAARRVHQTARY